jgi:hypothetical protein
MPTAFPGTLTEGFFKASKREFRVRCQKRPRRAGSSTALLLLVLLVKDEWMVERGLGKLNSGEWWEQAAVN